ncbi:MAG TPA: L-glutamate gamma-semialdehyde dehydrogenase, partial [Verrucomicrobiae bacterium]|nr:L-glutamate gamma-semialdehyde dehydrogenase [Verrucomicrobiae bacterium]
MAVLEYRPEPFTDFRKEETFRAFRMALEKVQGELGRTYPLIISGDRVMSETRFDSVNPANPSEVIGRVSQAERNHFEQAMQAAEGAFETWSRWDPKWRARILLKAAALMRRRKHEFSALLVLEVGKTWPEADADTAEAIDFLEFYAREMMRIDAPSRLTRMPGEDNEIMYVPMGIGAVIPPFNFPLAIACGMTAAAIVTGNTVLLKPAVPAPVIAFKLMELLEEAGLPPGVVNLLPSAGPEVGQWMVSDPRTHFISFTGSRDVGVKIFESAAKMHPGQRHLKRVVAELGGKDAIVVAEDADPEAAALGIVQAAFGFGGQKCSACSRAIIHKDLYDQVLELAVKRTERLQVGDPRNESVDVGPLAGERYFERVMKYIDIGKGEGRLMVGGGALETPAGGYFIKPTIFADVDPHARISQEEIFGPVVAFHKVEDFRTGIAVANDTEYGLTGAVYTRSRENIEYARREYHVGNLYINRKCTGALVGVHPFGGFKLSGTDSKAGGHDYLTLFLQAKSVSEQL